MPAILLKRQALSRTKIVHSGFWVCGEQPRPYDPDQHRAWLLRRRMIAS